MRSALLSLLLFLSGIASAHAIHVSRDSSHSSFYQSIKYIKCQPGQFSIDQIIALAQSGDKFQQVPYGVNFPYPTSAYWIYFDLENIDSLPVAQVLSINNPNLNVIDIYKCIGDSVVDSVKTGEFRLFSSREISHSNFLFHLRIPPHKTMRIYSYVYNHTDEIFLPVIVSSEKSFVESSQNITYYHYLRTGVLLFVVVAMFFLVIVTRTSISLFFLLYVLSVSFNLTSIWGINQK